jgi:glutaredoxin
MPRATLGLCLLLLTLLPSAVSEADVVVLKSGGRFVGVITSEDPDTVNLRSEGVAWAFKRDKIASVEKEAAGRDEELAAEKARTSKQAKSRKKGEATGSDVVIVYGTSWCGFCAKARAYFASHGIAYVDKDVETDANAHSEIVRKCQQTGRPFTGGVPVLDVYGRIIRGFDTAAIERAIQSHRG